MTKRKSVYAHLNKPLRAIVALLLLFGFSIAQDRRPDRGYKTANSYSISDIETVNVTNGNLMLNIPLAALPPGRGSSPGYSISINYNSRLWNNKKEYRSDGLGEGIEGLHYSRELIEASDQGGWHIDNGIYSLNLVNRQDELEAEAPCLVSTGEYNYKRNGYMFKLEMNLPSGQVTEFKPTGSGPDFNDLYEDGFYSMDPWGVRRTYSYHDPQGEGEAPNCTYNEIQITTAGMWYFTDDGSHMRLFIPYQPGVGVQQMHWTLYFPDGRTIESLPPDDNSIVQRMVDRNDNRVVWRPATVNGYVGLKIEDDIGRYVFAGWSGGQNKVIQSGTSGEILETTVDWTTKYVSHHYHATDAPNANYSFFDADLYQSLGMVSSITLPTQIGSRQYQFTYHASDSAPGTGVFTDGWGQLKSITLPSGAHAEYSYGLYGNWEGMTSDVLADDRVYNRVLTYDTIYDGQSQQITETTGYSSGGGFGNACTPDGHCRAETSYVGGVLNGFAYRIDETGGTTIEKIWENRRTLGSGWYMRIDPIVKTELTTVPDSVGNPSMTAVKDFDYDQNGNVLEVREYDWIPYNSPNIVRTSNPQHPGEYLPQPIVVSVSTSGLTLKRKTVNTYYYPTQNTLNGVQNDGNWSGNPSGPKFANLIKSTEIRDANDVVKFKTEYYYDGGLTDPDHGNLTEVRTWDSSKGQVSSPLVAGPSGNAISTTSVYNSYGAPTISTEANGNQTQLTYGNVSGPNGTVTDLYPTQTVVALNTVTARTSTSVFDFYTGLTTTATDVDNEVSTVTDYDVFGRPKKIRTAAESLLESWTQTTYHDGDSNDPRQYIVVKSDIETKGDGRKVATQFFDQLGRVRLSKTLEDASTQSATNETDGIKVQTRYKFASGYTYQLTSNPYSSNYPGNETGPTMGWTLSTSWSNGRHSEVQTFSGAGLPTAFGGSNTDSTGIVQTDIDANATTVTDQANKVRRSTTNGIGQLVRVDEPNSSNVLDSGGNPVQPTLYAYDVLNNLLTVTQAGSGTEQCGPGGGSCSQTRSFTYSSLSRLLTATNPESGTISYGYDPNGNLTSKTDARGIVTSYIYDQLNRVTHRNYTNEPSGSETPDVTYTYGTTAPAVGKLTKVESSVSTTEYTGFDSLGRVTSHKQTTDDTDYTTAYTYKLNGSLDEETYPSTRVVKNELDTNGDLSIVKSKKDSSQLYWNYAQNFVYSPAGAVTSMELGNGRWESTSFNSRLQPYQIALGTLRDGTELLNLGYDYGTTANNGNVLSQTITVTGTGGFTAVQNYTYDSLNRLKEAVERPDGWNDTNCSSDPTKCWKQEFSYDRYGNRNFVTGTGHTDTLGTCTTMCNPTFNTSNNQINSSGYSFDSAGNTTDDPSGKHFIYDAENKQIKVTDSSGTVGQYWYDGDGKRVKKYVPGTGETTVFVYDAAGKEIAEYSTQLASQQDAKVAYLTNDNLGSPRINTGANGTVTSRHDYQPYGEEIVTSQRTSGLGYQDDTVGKRFTGKERDEESGLDYFDARYYSSALGRFVNPDEFTGGPEELSDFADDASDNPTFYADLEVPQSLNKYQYTYNNPINMTDSNGHCPVCSVPIFPVVTVTIDIDMETPILRPAAPIVTKIVTTATEVGKPVSETVDLYPPYRPFFPFPASTRPGTRSAAEGGRQAQPQARPRPNRMAQGSRNAQKANQKRVDQAKKNLENLKQQLQEEKSKPNKTPEDKERIDKIEKQINRENDRLKKSEEHAKKGRGN